jgi:hypothetical protein
MCTNNNEIAAGVTPCTRDAIPNVIGRAAFNFARTSEDNPITSS